MTAPSYLQWLTDSGTALTSACGKPIPVWVLGHDLADAKMMSEWARHFRSHYCSDGELAFLKPSGMSNAEYFRNLKFPHQTEKPGPSIRAGDFAELLVADYLEYVREYLVYRTRYDRKTITNESTKGSDVIGFKKKPNLISDQDELLIFEVKAKASPTKGKSKKVNVLQTAIDHSVKDEFRLAESLNAMRQRLYDKGDHASMAVVGRFQQESDNPYKRRYGAAAVYTSSSVDAATLALSDSSSHPGKDAIELIVIHGSLLMKLVHALYERAADEA
jgi:hypothetical protein